MIKCKQIISSILSECCYIVFCDQEERCILIDPGSDYDQINRFIISNGLTVDGVLLTHGHFDHIYSANKFQQLGCKVFVHEKDADKCLDNKKNLSIVFNPIETFNPDVLLVGEEGNIDFNWVTIKYIHTPGHSMGSVCYLINKYLFSGDTVFENGIGRTDFYDGNTNDMIKSVQKINSMLDKYILKAGH